MPNFQPRRLADPLPITEHQWPENVTPTVSIRCITYNHAPFIERCIQGFLIQQTTFPVEIIIHDDASNDGATDIIRGYREEYPQLIKAILQPENLRSQGIPRERFIAPLLRGDYIAVCEGDDYWVDPKKLQKQINFLEDNPDYVISGHDAFIVDQEGAILESSKLPDSQKRDHSQEELIRNQVLVLTMSMVYRNVAIDRPPERRRVLNGDSFFLSLIGHHGKSKYHDDIAPAAYRRHSGGVYSSLSHRRQREERSNTWFWLYSYYARIGEREHAEFYWKKYTRVVLISIPAGVLAKEVARRIFWPDRIKNRVLAMGHRLLRNIAFRETQA